MEQNQLQRAVIEAMQDPKVIAEFAISVSKKILEQKSKPNSDEGLYVKNHVLFAEAGDVKGTFMIAKEIEEAILELNPNFEIRTRTFGKELLSEAKEVKSTNKGRAYFVRAIVADMKEYAANIAVEDAKVLEEEVEEEVEEEKSKKDKKKDKKKDIYNDEKDFEENKELPKIEPKEAFDGPKVDVMMLIAAVEGFDDLEDYKEHLDSMSLSKLIKHINKFKMPIICENKDEDEIVDSIVALLKANLPKEEEAEEEVVGTAAEVVEDEAQKNDKKSKKDKKKDKKKSIDSEDLDKISKKDKKKKKNKKDK